MRIDINNCTLQEAMDYAVQRMVEQGGRCGKDEHGHFRCLYGDGNGRHCGVGWLLPEDDAALMKATMGIQGLVIAKRDRLPKLVVENVEAMAALQGLGYTRITNHGTLEAARQARAEQAPAMTACTAAGVDAAC